MTLREVCINANVSRRAIQGYEKAGLVSASGKNNSADLEKKITCSGELDILEKLIVFVKNDNKVAVEMNIEVEFYDKDGGILGSDSRSLSGVGGESEVAVQMYNTPEKFDNYKIYVDVTESTNTTFYKDIDLKHNDNGKEIAVQVKNKSEDIIEEVSVSVVYYNGKKIVGIYENTEYSIKSNRSANFTMYYPHNKNYDDVKFDEYKIFITEAYSSDLS